MHRPPTPTERLHAIVEQGLCIGCGLCQAVAGPGAIRVTRVANGHERPVVVGPLDHEVVDRIYDVCPGTRVEGLPQGLVAGDTKVDNVWGPWRRIVRAWATGPEVRHEGSTGGVLTALGQYLLASGRVRFVLHAKASAVHPTSGERTLSFTEAGVLAAAGSRYGPTAPLIDVTEVLDRGEPFAFVGKPCDVAALRSWARHDARAGELVRFWLAPVCGGYLLPESTERAIRAQGLVPEQITGFRYRGRGCPGPTRMETADRVVEIHYLDLWGEDEAQWGLPWRCKLCPDGIGEAADLAAADTWVGGSPGRQASESDPGTNAVIARTVAGQELLEAAERAGYLTIERDIVPDDLSLYQPHQVHKKYAMAGRYEGLADLGRIVPATARLRLDALAAELPASVNRSQRAGVRRRVAEGKASEAPPAPCP